MKTQNKGAASPTDEANPSTAVAKPQSNGLQTFNVEAGEELPDLGDAVEIPVNISSEYWTPEKEGESKRVFFSHIADRALVDKDSGEVTENLPTAFFFEKKNGAINTVCNSSKRLVGAIEQNNIQKGTPLLITYLGKQKNVNNSFFSDRWSIKPLIVKI